MTAISEYSNQTSNMTTDSNSASSAMPSSGTTRSDSTSSLIDGVVQQPHSSTSADVRYANGDSASSTSPSQSQTPDVDPQITEALRSKDRLYVLKLGEVMEGLIREKRGRAELSPSTTYQRLLIHRCSAYYKLTPETDSVTKAISVVFSAESRIPGRRLAELVPLEPTTQPAFKIMRRSQQDRRVKPQSHAGSVTGEDADSSDVEPSETGSMGGRSNATGGSGKKRMTIEERTAAYEQARSRIFMGFEEKEKDMSASSSSGLTSASASHAGSSVGDTEDATSSLATESEWSPNSFNKDSRRSNTSSSSRSLRSSSLPYPNGSGNSSRNSRAPSPSFTYPTLYEPHSSPSYDGTHVGSQQSAPAGYQNPPFTYQYPPPSHPPNQPYMPPTYPYYSSYPYGPPPLSQHPQNSSEALPSGDMYSPPPPPPHSMYGTPYMWHPPPNPTPMHSAPPMPTQAPNGQMPGPPPPLQQLPYQPYMQASPYPYPMSGYYTPPPHGPVHSPPSTGGQIYEDPRMMPGPGNNNGHISNNSSQRGNISQRGMPRGGAMNGGAMNGGAMNGGAKRNNAPVPRAAWSYGPGVGLGGIPLNGNNSGSSNGTGETIGPRLSSMRRTSNTSTGSSGHYRPSAPNDDVASTAVRFDFRSEIFNSLCFFLIVVFNFIFVEADVSVNIFPTPPSSSTRLGSWIETRSHFARHQPSSRPFSQQLAEYVTDITSSRTQWCLQQFNPSPPSGSKSTSPFAIQ
ncbi:hypothetical protein K435DRAFT_92450 [Dendrothele bispora CBS 962.96]|uniref:SUZ domain-containing protein n=1 Tax=Dendrothele bispora (strain CBS 962.96) TaxID=1314807 RepID=A0A4V4HI79_DENBC|nr:hypothetical protein K435DRAFT_92450 [Dendrothele bispora CBS 962.96]